MKTLKPLVTATLILASAALAPIFSACVHRTSQVASPSKVDSILEREGVRLSLETRLEVGRIVQELSGQYGMDPVLILAVMKVESTFNPKALSNKDARGLMQVRPIVVREVAKDLGIDPRDHVKLYAHEFNIRVGVHYLSLLLKKFNGDVKKALMAYNAGPTTVARLYKNRSVPEGGYQGKVLRTYHALSDS